MATVPLLLQSVESPPDKLSSGELLELQVAWVGDTTVTTEVSRDGSDLALGDPLTTGWKTIPPVVVLLVSCKLPFIIFVLEGPLGGVGPSCFS